MRTGTKGVSVIELAQSIIQKYDKLSAVAMLSVELFKKNNGIGNDKAATLAAAFEISRRVESQSKWFSNKKITSPSDIAEIFMPLFRDEVKEKFIVVCLNSANKIIRYEIISVGSLNSSIVHAREDFKVAIVNNSANIILLHNHPSGNEDPSKEDIIVTKRLVEAGKVLEINVFDHIIIAGNNFTSFVDRKII